MSRRTIKAAMAVLLGLMSLGLPAVVSSPPAGAAVLPYDLELVEGSLDIRDSEEPAELKTPTTLEGTVDDATGIITGGDFSAAPLDFQFDITDPVEATVFVDATFTQLTPGAVTGSVTNIDQNTAKVTIDVDVKVDLHIQVGNPAFITNDCTATPVSLRMTTTVPYDFATDRLTLTDADFSVPQVPETANCIEVVAEGVNEKLAGGGHSITMVMEGPIPSILVGTEPTTTTLTVAPESSRAGDEVTLSAVVAPTPDAQPGTPTGVVEFSDGDTVLGTAPVAPDGTATFSTSSLPVGIRALEAAYKGGLPYLPSTSAAVNHLVAQAPTVTLPETISPVTIGGNPRLVTVQVVNPADLGAPIENGRLDVTIARVASNTAAFDVSRITLEWFDGDSWEPVTLTEGPPRNLKGSIGPATGAVIAPGTTSDVRLRITAPVGAGTPSTTQCLITNTTCPGPLTMTAQLKEVDSGTGAEIEVMGEDTAPVNLIETTRRPTTMTFAGGGPRPHTLRQGYTLLVGTPMTPNFGNVPWSGFAEVYIDGVQVPLRDPTLPFAAGYADQFAVKSPSITGLALLPTDIDPGSHSVTVRYLGDPFHGPGEVTSSFYVHPAAGQPFLCREKTLTLEAEWGANVVFEAEVPAAATPGSPIAVPVTDARLLMHRPTFSGPLLFIANNTTVPVGTSNLEGITFDIGPDGSGTAGAIGRTGGTAIAASPNPAPESSVDQTYTFTDLNVSATVTGDPGDVVPVELNEFTISYRDPQFDFPLSARCFARDDEPMELGEVEIAGTELSVSPEGKPREITDEVELTADTFPGDAAGTVSFSSDKDGALGDVAVSGGSATLATDELSPGDHVITASFNATDADVPDTTDTETVHVQYSPRSGTEAFVVAALTDFVGSAEEEAVQAGAERIDDGTTKGTYLTELSRSDEYLTYFVNQMYLNTLEREGDESGLAYWIEKLRAGYPPAKVAANFYASVEYYAKVGGTDEAWIDDLYEKLLGRPSEESGRLYWIGEIAKRGRGGVALAFYQSLESRTFRVEALYDFFLDRAPSAADITYWTKILEKRGDLVLAVFLASSDEYADRAEDRFPIID